MKSCSLESTQVPTIVLSHDTTALSVAEIKAQYNPRCVVPQYYWDERTEHGQLQLLLPVNLQGKKTGEIGT